MDNVHYLSNSATIMNGQYPVTVQGLEFIQRQIMTLNNIVPLGGSYFVLKESTATDSGVVVFNGEIMPLSGLPAQNAFIVVRTTKQTINTNNGSYTDVRECRHACYSFLRGETSSEEAEADQGKNFRLRTLFKEWKTNVELWEKLSELLRTGVGIPVEPGIFTRDTLNTRLTTARLVCLPGSSTVNNYSTFAVDVYALGGGGAYQELTGPDFRRWGRYYHPDKTSWDEFQPISDQLTIEVKVTPNAVFFRHGFLPPYASLIALRKKTRSTNMGNIKAKDGKPIKKRCRRKPKNAWYHSWKMVFSKGEPNTWYVPKCLDADKGFKQYIGQEYALTMRSLLFRSVLNLRWRIAGVHRNWKRRPYGYAKIGLGITAGPTHKTPVLSMAQLKFRVVRNIASGGPLIRFTTD